MCTRCKACDAQLHEGQMASHRAVNSEGEILLIPQDFCINCRGSVQGPSYLNREYAFQDISTGLTPCAGFSDNY